MYPALSQFCLTATALAVWAAQSVALGNDGFIVEPVTTDLQRLATRFQGDVYAELRCDLYSDRQSDLEEVKFELDDLESMLQHVFQDGDNLEILVCYQIFHMKDDLETKEIFEQRLVDLGKRVGFSEVRIRKRWSDQSIADWRKRTRAFRNFENKEGATETGYHGRTLHAFPVNTKLSKLFYEDADLVVGVKQDVDVSSQATLAVFAEELKECVEAIRPTNRGLVHFLVPVSSRELPAVEELFGPMFGDNRDSLVFDVAQAAGFESFQFRRGLLLSKVGELLEKPAPEFELTRLDGQTVSFSEYADGRPALINFWGIACGNCVLESPHFTSLHKKYGKRFAIVAVNAYQESAEEISEFMESRGLVHPVFLNGKETARKVFGVSSYPTTFWVAPEGNVTDVVVGFDDLHGAELLEEKVIKSLDGESNAPSGRSH
ncbi:MAG: hypothetical protein Aurels2KO_34530 [Aureliella sp.]